MIAKERIRQLERIGKCLLRKRDVGTEPEDLDIQGLEFLVVDLPGRYVFRSRAAKISNVELKEDMLFALELAQANLFP